MGGAYLKNWDQLINVGMIGHADVEDIRLLGGGGVWWHAPPGKIANPTITTLICIILNLLRSHQADLFGSWGARAHPTHHGPCLRACWKQTIFASFT